MYSFTEKKRIRKSFAKQQSVLDVPGLLATQLKSYDKFLQRFVSSGSREIVGLEAAFNSVFPIQSNSGNAKLDYLGYSFGSTAFDVNECTVRGLTYGVPLKAKIRLTIFDKESNNKNVKEIKESEVYLGEIPLMTDNGSFVINGTQRVIVSQLHRSPGVFFEHDRGKTHASGKLLFSARIIPYRGSWVDFEFDHKDILYFRVDRRRKLPVTVLLRSIGLDNEAILDTFYSHDEFSFSKGKFKLKLIAQRLRGEIAKFDIKDKKSEVIVAKDKRITARHIREIEKANIDTMIEIYTTL